MDEYISVSEFAKRAGVSRQAIQQRLDTSLRKFVKLAQGKKLLNIKGLELFHGDNLAQGFDKVCQGSNDVDQAVIELLREQSNMQRQQLEMLQKQLESKDNQIASLNDRLAETTAALQAAQQSAQAAQALHAGTMQQLLDSPKKRRWPWNRKKHNADPDQ
jgi:chromosome segregation ATPase